MFSVSLIETVAFAREEWNAGIGAAIGLRDGAIAIVEVLPNSSAQQAGVVEGEVILAIDGIGTALLGVEECIRLIRGPVGTTVKLKLKGAKGSVRTLEIKRRILPPQE